MCDNRLEVFILLIHHAEKRVYDCVRLVQTRKATSLFPGHTQWQIYSLQYLIYVVTFVRACSTLSLSASLFANEPCFDFAICGFSAMDWLQPYDRYVSKIARTQQRYEGSRILCAPSDPAEDKIATWFVKTIRKRGADGMKDLDGALLNLQVSTFQRKAFAQLINTCIRLYGEKSLEESCELANKEEANSELSWIWEDYPQEAFWAAYVATKYFDPGAPKRRDQWKRIEKEIPWSNAAKETPLSMMYQSASHHAHVDFPFLFFALTILPPESSLKNTWTPDVSAECLDRQWKAAAEKSYWLQNLTHAEKSMDSSSAVDAESIGEFLDRFEICGPPRGDDELIWPPLTPTQEEALEQQQSPQGVWKDPAPVDEDSDESPRLPTVNISPCSTPTPEESPILFYQQYAYPCNYIPLQQQQQTSWQCDPLPPAAVDVANMGMVSYSTLPQRMDAYEQTLQVLQKYYETSEQAKQTMMQQIEALQEEGRMMRQQIKALQEPVQTMFDAPQRSDWATCD